MEENGKEMLDRAEDTGLSESEKVNAELEELREAVRETQGSPHLGGLWTFELE